MWVLILNIKDGFVNKCNVMSEKMMSFHVLVWESNSLILGFLVHYPCAKGTPPLSITPTKSW